MFNQINHTQSHNRVTAIQIGEVGDITISSSQPIGAQLGQQIRTVSNNHIQWQSAAINNGTGLGTAQSTSTNHQTLSMQCTKIRSEDEQLVPNMTLNMTIDIAPGISFYQRSNMSFNLDGNIRLSPLSNPNFDLAEEVECFEETFCDLRPYIEQLERARASQPAAGSEFLSLNSEENSTNSTLNVDEFDRLLAQREQEDFEEANLPAIRAAEYRATLRENSALTVNDEAEMPNESISLVRAPIEDDDPSIN
ncbi:hypothetical protein [Arsenophonus sp.]|uniref:hypothetical protein n=1 Tax=Arsenophonus sp. TaxID=1872640 RepID=UPI002859D8FA|nr:hypothetical protein [Arsenophonus sp.]MDR5618068.1 hypothetical protein [Arsenophonus sp.]